MNESKISTRYSKALFDLALSMGILDTTREEMKYVLSTSQLPEFKELIESPVFNKNQKKESFRELFEGKVSSLVIKFLFLLIEKHREIFIKNISLDFLEMYKNHKGIKELKITTPTPLGKDTKDKIVTLVKSNYKAEIELVEIINEQLIGGFIIQIDDMQFDASVHNRLNKIRNELLNASILKAV